MKLKIAVLVKQVPDHEALIQVKNEHELEIEDRYGCSFFDEIAIQAALNIKKDLPDSDLLALSAGGRRSVEALRRSIALGIEEVEHLGSENLEQADSNYIAQVLGTRLKTYQPDLVICGKQAGDTDFAAVGPMVAEFLGFPHLSGVVSLEIDSDKKKIKLGREMEGEIWTLESNFPLLITADKGLAEPQVPLVTRVMKAMKADVQNIPISEMGINSNHQLKRILRRRYVSAPSRPEVIMMQEPFPGNVSELVNYLWGKGVLS